MKLYNSSGAMKVMLGSGSSMFYSDILLVAGVAVAKRPVDERLRTWTKRPPSPPVVQFQISDAVFTLDLTRTAAPWVSRTTHEAPQLEVVTDADTFSKIWRREIIVWEAVSDGRLTLRGDLRLGHALQRHFDPQADL